MFQIFPSLQRHHPLWIWVEFQTSNSPWPLLSCFVCFVFLRKNYYISSRISYFLWMGWGVRGRGLVIQKKESTEKLLEDIPTWKCLSCRRCCEQDKASPCSPKQTQTHNWCSHFRDQDATEGSENGCAVVVCLFSIETLMSHDRKATKTRVA